MGAPAWGWYGGRDPRNRWDALLEPRRRPTGRDRMDQDEDTEPEAVPEGRHGRAWRWWWSGWEEPDLDADRVGDASQVAGVAGDNGGLVADGGHDDDRVDYVRGPGGGAGDASGAAGARVVGEDVAGLEDPGDLVLGSAAPGLGQDDDWDERPDPRAGQFIVQGEEVRVKPFGRQQRASVVDDGRHYPAARCGSSSISPASIRNSRARCRDAAGSGPCSLSYSATSSRAAARPAACRAAARAFSVAASASHADTGLPSPAAAALIVSSISGGTEIDSFRTVMPP